MIDLQNVTAGYGKHTVLHNMSATLEAGKLTAIIGPNGCGKSTLLKAILQILPCLNGGILLDRIPLHTMNRHEIARRIAYLTQGHSIPDMTVAELVLMGRFPHLPYPRRYTRRDHAIAEAAMAQMELSALAEKHLSILSGGMRQNAYIAMALAQDTDYILLDEPTTYLDISHQLALMKTLRSLADSGKGIVTVMHDLPMAFDFADEILVMREGRMILQGSPETISASPLIEETFGVTVQRNKASGRYFYDYSSLLSKNF